MTKNEVICTIKIGIKITKENKNGGVKMKENIQTKRRNSGLFALIALLLIITIVASGIGIYAWAKYTSLQSGNATAQVAKWNFNLSLKSGATSVTGNNSLNLADTLDQEATHVLDGKIAPGTSGTFDIEIDTRGTEVAMFYDVTIGMSNCPRNITFSKKGPGESGFTVISAAKTGDESERARTVNFSKYLTLNDVTTANTNETKFVETIKWDWPYELTGNDPATNQPYTTEQKTAYDLRDNADQGRTVTLNITATGTEVMNTPLSEATVTYGDNKTVANGGTIKLLTTDEPITLKPTSGSEAVTFSSSNASVATVASSETVQNGVVVSPVGAGSTIITLTGQETGKQIIINVTINTPGTPVSELTKDNYGQYVNLGTNILDLNNVTLEDGSHPAADWRVFSKDANGGLWLILADYMPNENGKLNVVDVGLLKGTGNRAVYNVYSSAPRETLINGLKGIISGKANWNGLIAGSDLYDSNNNLINSNIKVQGAVDLETWAASWNANTGYTQLTLSTDSVGYKINNGYNIDLSGNTGFNNTLYFPHKTYQNEVYGYWLASLSAASTYSVVYVTHNGYVNYNRYDDSYYGVRPAVYLPSTVKLNTPENAVWTIAE